MVDEHNQFISQRTFAELALLQPSLTTKEMIIHDRSGKMNPLSIPLAEPQAIEEEVTVWDDSMPAKAVSKHIDDWFSEYLQKPIRLMYMHEQSVRQADQRYAITKEDKVSFADGYPILIISQASMDLLNSKLASPLAINRFRANIIVSE